MVFINPLYPPLLGDFGIWGTPPNPWQEVSCTSFLGALLYPVHLNLDYVVYFEPFANELCVQLVE